MRNLTILVILMLLHYFSFSQIESKRELVSFEDLYNNALETCCKSVQYKNNDLIYIDFDPYTTNHLSSSFCNIEIQVLKYNELCKLTSHNKTIILLKMFPIEHTQGTFIINIASYEVSKKGRRLEYSLQLGMGTKVKYRYDCGADGFLFDKIE